MHLPGRQHWGYWYQHPHSQGGLLGGLDGSEKKEQEEARERHEGGECRKWEESTSIQKERKLTPQRGSAGIRTQELLKLDTFTTKPLRTLGREKLYKQHRSHRH